MKALRLHEYGSPATLTLETVARPQLADDQVLVKIHATSANHIEGALASGALRYLYELPFPWIPGNDFAGTVEAVGAAVTGFQPGDAVYGSISPVGGTYAEYAAVSAEQLAHAPTSLSLLEAAAVPVAAQTAWQGLFNYAHLQAGQTVLIHGGAGAVGAYAIQFAHQAGARVITTASPEDEAFLQELGADQVIDYKSTRFEQVVAPVDVVLDLVGGDTQQRSYAVLKPGGYLVAVNQPASEEEAAKHQVSASFLHMNPSSADLAHIAALLDAGKVRVDIAQVLPLTEALSAWETLARKLPGWSSVKAESTASKGKHGKIVLQVADLAE